MPRLSCWFIRLALIHFLLGFSIGMLLLWHKGIPLHPLLWLLLPTHIELLLVGWTLQLAMGVAYWILPRFQTDRRSPYLAWSAFIALNLGVWVIVSLSFVRVYTNELQLLGRTLEVGGILAFLAHAWPRVKPIADLG